MWRDGHCDMDMIVDTVDCQHLALQCVGLWSYFREQDLFIGRCNQWLAVFGRPGDVIIAFPEGIVAPVLWQPDAFSICVNVSSLHLDNLTLRRAQQPVRDAHAESFRGELAHDNHIHVLGVQFT